MTIEERNEKIFAMRVQGLSVSQISEKTGVHRSTIYSVVSQAKPKKKIARKAKAILSAPIDLAPASRGQMKAIILQGGLEDILEAVRRI